MMRRRNEMKYDKWPVARFIIQAQDVPSTPPDLLPTRKGEEPPEGRKTRLGHRALPARRVAVLSSTRDHQGASCPHTDGCGTASDHRATCLLATGRSHRTSVDAARKRASNQQGQGRRPSASDLTSPLARRAFYSFMYTKSLDWRIQDQHHHTTTSVREHRIPDLMSSRPVLSLLIVRVDRLRPLPLVVLRSDLDIAIPQVASLAEGPPNIGAFL